MGGKGFDSRERKGKVRKVATERIMADLPC